MIEGKTKNGFEFVISEDASNDWELLKAIRKCNDDASYVVDVAEGILGAEQLEKLEEYIREKDGKVTVTAMNTILEEILESAAELKNSTPSPEG